MGKIEPRDHSGDTVHQNGAEVSGGEESDESYDSKKMIESYKNYEPTKSMKSKRRITYKDSLLIK